VIGARSDVERVPIENLAVFYRKYYQPDNADLIVAGKFDEAKALALIAQTLGALPKPERVLTQPYTVEPTQEGEREVILRRVGTVQAIMAVYHVPAALHPDMAALEVLAQVLGAPQTGRLYKDLVDTKKAVATYMYASDMHDPGFALAYVQLKPDQNVEDAAQVLLKDVEGVAATPPTSEEVDRAKARILKNLELAMANSQQVALMLGGYVGSGDWRLMFLDRDEVAKITPDDVSRVAKAYLKSSNRTLGEFIPTASPDRAEIAQAPDAATRFKNFTGAPAVQEGEVFDPTPKNVEGRLVRTTLPNGMKLVMFPKKTRGGIVVASINFRSGSEESLFGKSTAASMAGAMLMRGTKSKNRQQIQDETDRLKAQINVWASAGYGGAWARTVAANLPDTLRFVNELLREPSFPEAEFEQVKQQRLAGAESQKTEPMSLAPNTMYHRLDVRYPKGDTRYAATLDEQIEDTKKVTLADAKGYYNDFFAPAEGEIVISGQFDPGQVKKELTELFGNWKSAKPYQRIPDTYAKPELFNVKLETPDKQNAMFMAGTLVKMSQDDPDYAAVTIGGMILGGSANSRLFQRIRVKDGLSYGANSNFFISAKDEGSAFYARAIAAPQNMPKVEAAFKEEVERLLKDGVTADELEKAKKTWLDEQALARADESNLASELGGLERWSRTMDWQARLEATVAGLTPEQVNAAMKRHLDAASISIVKGGDFKKAGVYQ
jgi:zinc protease